MWPKQEKFSAILRSTTMSKKLIYFMSFILVLVMSANIVQAGVAYKDPPGDWDYIFDCDTNAPPLYPEFFDGVCFDGKWDCLNGSSSWDYTMIGEGNPGGVSALTVGDVNFIRMQDTGNPVDYDIDDLSNRKLFFAHEFDRFDDLSTAIANKLVDAVTLTFRVRIATGEPLDDLYRSYSLMDP